MSILAVKFIITKDIMASIKTLFDKITIIQPEKVGILGERGLEQELIANIRLFAEEIWNSLPISTENTMPIIGDCLPIATDCYCSNDILQSYLSSINDSIKNISTLLHEIQKRTKTPESNLKKGTRMPESLKECQINTSTGDFLACCSGITGKTNIEEGCEAMGIPCSLENLLNYGEMLFSTYKNAAVMVEDFIMRTASMVMTEEELKEITNHNMYYGEHLPSIYNTEEDLRRLCNELVNQGFLERATSIDDFVYFFSGKGEVPTKHLEWIGKNTNLSIFLDCYFIKINTDIPSKWKLAQRIFNKPNLRQSLNNTRVATKQAAIDKQYSIFTDIIDLL